MKILIICLSIGLALYDIMLAVAALLQPFVKENMTAEEKSKARRVAYKFLANAIIVTILLVFTIVGY
ncbi:hypothetical protein [Larkinella ripae]